MSGPGKWTLNEDAPEPQEFPAETYEEQNSHTPEKAPEPVRAYDENGNVRPADERYTDETKPKGTRRKK